MEGSIVQKRKESMLQGPLLPSIISFTIPVILTSVLQLLFNAADLVVGGRSGAVHPSARWVPPIQ